LGEGPWVLFCSQIGGRSMGPILFSNWGRSMEGRGQLHGTLGVPKLIHIRASIKLKKSMEGAILFQN